MDRFRPELLIVAAAVLWGTTGTAQDLGDVQASPVVVGVSRIALGGALLALVALATTRSGPSHAHPGTRGWYRHGVPWAVVAGIVAVAGYQACFFAAVERAGVALGTLVAIGSGPVFTGIVALVASREQPGAALVPGDRPGRRGLCPAAGPWRRQRARRRRTRPGPRRRPVLRRLHRGGQGPPEPGVPGPTVMATFFLGGALLLAPALLVADTAGLTTTRGLTMVFWLGVATTAVSYVFFSAGLHCPQSSTVATLSLTEPLTAALLGVVVHGRPPGAWCLPWAPWCCSPALLVMTTSRPTREPVGEP